MTAQLQSPWIQIIDLNGEPVSGAKIRVYAPTTTTPMDVFSDTFLTVPVEQPIIADAAGRILRLYVAGPYKIRIEDSEGELIVERDNQDPALPNGFGGVDLVPVASGGTGAPNAAAARANLGAASADSVTQLTQTVADNQAALGDLATKDTITKAELAADFAVLELGRAFTNTKSNSSTTASIPADNSIPQVGEGTLLFSLAYTPVAADSTLIIECEVQFGLGASNQTGVIALFKDSDANALAADACFVVNNSETGRAKIHFEVSSGSTSSRTYTIRMGTNTGTATPDSVGFGGVQKSYLSIREVKYF